MRHLLWKFFSSLSQPDLSQPTRWRQWKIFPFWSSVLVISTNGSHQATPQEDLSENIFGCECMNEHSEWARVGWLEIVTLRDIIYYFLLRCSESKGGFPGWTTLDQSYLTKHCNWKDKNEITSCQIGICAIWWEKCPGNIIPTFPSPGQSVSQSLLSL